MGRFLDRLKNFGSKILGGIRSLGEKVVPIVKKMAPHAASILKTLPFAPTQAIGNLIEPAVQGVDTLWSKIR